MRSYLLSRPLIGVLLPIFASPILAEEEQTAGTRIEEIVVTATRRAENLQDVSGSVSALTTEDLKRAGHDDLQSIARTLPGVSLHQIVRNRSVFTIRGINTDVGETQLTQEPVSLYINDMPAVQPYGALVQPDLRLYDIERIEVLRGPQGTLFGSGSLGGAVRVLTKSPDLYDLTASVRVDGGHTRRAGSRTRFDGMVNMPLVPNELAIRAVAYVRDEAGWVRNIATGQSNDNADSGGRIALLWKPSDGFEGKLEYLAQRSDPDDGDTWNPALGQFNRSTVINEGRKADIDQAGLMLTWMLDRLAIYSSSNWKRIDSNWNVQLGMIPGFASGVLITEAPDYDTDFVSQEVRLLWEPDDKLSVVAGIFYFEASNESPFDFRIPGLADFVNDIVGVPDFLQRDSISALTASIDMEERAIFLDLRRELTPGFSVSAGVRFSETETQYAAEAGYGFDFATLTPFVESAITNFNDDSDTMWRLVGAWQPDDSQHYYINLSKGFRVGQVNPNNGPSNIDSSDYVIPPGYQMDEALNIELGAKLSLARGSIRLNAALYRIDWTDIQVDAARASDQRNYIANAGDAISQGLEIELEAWLTERLRIDGSLTFQNAEIDKVDPVQRLNSGAVEGDNLPGAADFLASATAEYSWPWRDFSFLARASINHVGDSVNRFSLQSGTGLPNPDFAINEAYTNVNTSMALIRDKWELTLYAENLTDNDNIVLNVGMQSGNPYATLRPRTIGARFEYFF